MKWLLLCASIVSLACGRTDLLSRQRTLDEGGLVHAADPLQGVWEHDQNVPGIYLNRQLSFTDGAWEVQILHDNANGDEGRQVDMGTYVIAATAVEMKITASSCQSLTEITNPRATFERHGDKMTMLWQSDSASALPPETLFLARIATLSDLGVTGCNVPTVGTSTVFLPNAVTPVP
jgi:hypothetical protein